MTDPKQNDPVETPEATTAAPEAEAAPVDPIVALEAEKADLKDKLLRTLAEMENLRRRTARDVHDGRTYAVTAFARDMLTVADNINRALESAPKDAAEGPLKALIEGVALTERDLIKTLERHGVKKLEPVGQKFDPNFHQAMFEAPSEHPAGMVSTLVQAGYAIGDRVLRPALVGISKGPAKAAPTEAKANGAAEG
ncbi:nucleotide exchange factor GrpE [Terrarubrum flagellatum]|uniref:nucleotide exchange factor GrpE n=1 Tax=Terrirubrum flagellatum TaxID=2895980 RepID=UPI0031450A20